MEREHHGTWMGVLVMSAQGEARARVGVGLLVAAACFATPGCSLVFDTEPYREEPGPVPVPSAPTVSIAPEDPTSLDDLVAIIDVDAVDPLGEPVVYRYAWQRDAAATHFATDTVPASGTAKGEVWTLSVTPVAGFPERIGQPGTASVAIGNVPPSLGFARLSRYEVWADESITASAGGVVDPDGDVLSTVYEWSVNGAVTTVTSSTFELDDSIAPGDEISVTISVNDGVATSEARTAGPATVRESAGWRQLEPNHAFDASKPLFFLDGDRGRMLFLREGALWEYRVSGSRAVPWAKLNLTNLPELFGCSVIHDAASSRFLIWGGVDFSTAPAHPNTALYELSVPSPGLETWREVPSSEAPPPRIAHVTINDAERHRAIILGGGVPGAVPIEISPLHDDVWELDYRSANPTFRLVSDAPLTPSATFMALATDASAGMAYLFGGFSASGSALEGIFAYDLTEAEPANAIAEIGSLSSARGGVAAIDMGDGTALLVDGGSALVGTTVAPLVERFTYSSRSSSVVTLTGDRPSPAAGPELLPFGDGVLWTSSLFANDLSVYEMRGLDVQRVLAPNVNTPGATALANVIRGTGAGAGVTFAFGVIRRNFDRAVGDTTFSFDGSLWQPVGALSSPAFARWGASGVVDGQRTVRQLLGGSVTRVYAPQSSIISSDSEAWVEVRPDEAALNPFLASDYPRPAWVCASDYRVRAGNVTYVLDGDGTAASEALAAGTGGPFVNAPAYEALAPAGGAERIVVFGGSHSPVWFTTEPCALEDTWVQQTPSGGPVGRFSPALVKLVSVANSSSSRLLLFGGATEVDNSRTHYGDLWLVTMDSAGSITTQLLEQPSHPSPAPRSAAMFGWDTLRERAILFGGEGPPGREFSSSSSGTLRADTWEYRLPEGL